MCIRDRVRPFYASAFCDASFCVDWRRTDALAANWVVARLPYFQCPDNPHQPFLASENRRHMDYPVIKTASLCVASFWHRPNTGVWQTDERTNRQTHMPSIAYTTLAKLFVWFTVIKIINKSSRVNFNRNKNNTHWSNYVRSTITNLSLIHISEPTRPY